MAKVLLAGSVEKECRTTQVVERRSYALAWMVAVIVLGFGLRIYRLADQSLWNDEAFSVATAAKGVGDLGAVFATTDAHPPLYFYLLHFWMLLAGQSELAVRFLSVIFGLLGIPFMYILGRRLLTVESGIVAALLMATSPVLVYYSQETRMYSVATLLSVASAYALLQALRTNSRRAWIAFGGTNLLALYSHYYAAFVLAGEVVIALIWVAVTGKSWRIAAPPRRADGAAWRIWPRELTGLVVSCAAVGVGYLPWLSIVIRQYDDTKTYYPGQFNLVRGALEVWEAFVTGRFGGANEVAAVAVGAGLLSLVGWLTAGGEVEGEAPRTSSWQAKLLLACYLAVPSILFFVLLAQKPKFGARYLIMAWPAFGLLLANGIATPFRMLRRFGTMTTWLLLALTVSGSAYFLNHYYHDPAYARDDWRATAALITAQRQPNDAVILVAGYASPAFGYYYRSGDWLAEPDQVTISLDKVVDVEEASSMLKKLAGKKRVWLVLWQDDVADPNGIVADTLGRIGSRDRLAERFGSIKVERYELPDQVDLTLSTKPQVELEMDFGDRLTLVGYDPPRGASRPGESVEMTLYWRSMRELDDDYSVAARLVDDQGQEWGRSTKRPAGYMYYTQRWVPGNLVVGQMKLPVLRGTPPGAYNIQLTVFSASTMRGLDVIENGVPVGTERSIGHFEVTHALSAPSSEELGVAQKLDAKMGLGVVLLGAFVRDAEVAAGSQINLTTLWEAAGRERSDFSLQLRLLDANGSEVMRQVGQLARAGYPTGAWQTGERLRGQHALRVPAGAEGRLRIVAQLLEKGSGVPAGPEVGIAEGRVLGRKHNTTRPPVPRVAQATQLGEDITLLGYDLDAKNARPGDTIHLRLYWHASRTPTSNYKVFTHLLDKEGHIAAQEDGIPGRGALPTSGWVAGEYITDDYQLPVKSDALPGGGVLEIGMYDEARGTRLPAIAHGNRSLGDHVLLQDAVQIVR